MASDLAVIDLSLLPMTEFKGKLEKQSLDELNKLREACEEVGFFHIINHGVEGSLIQTIDSVSRDVFSLPKHEKDQAIFPTFYTGYLPPIAGFNGKDSLPESMAFPGVDVLLDSIEQISDKLWGPGGNQHFRNTLQAYTSKMTELGHNILKLLFLSLGLDVSKHCNSHPFDSVPQGWARMNSYYNSENNESERLFISKAHTDLGCITILYQDDAGGLQIRTKQGNWINANPLPGAFVVNLGDCIQLWSNGRYRSSEHRVVYRGLRSRENRLSVAFFYDVLESAEIKAPKELSDNQHPQKYKAVTFGDMKKNYKKMGPTLAGVPSQYLL